MKYYFGRGRIRDGKLDENCGRIVIYDDKILVSHIRSADHNYLLRGLASRYRLKKDDVISNAIRLYFRHEGHRVIITDVRKIDEEKFFAKKDFYSKLIKKEIK